MFSITPVLLHLLHLVPLVLMLCATRMAWRQLQQPARWFLAVGLGLATAASVLTLITQALLSRHYTSEIANLMYPAASALGGTGWIVFAVGYLQMLTLSGSSGAGGQTEPSVRGAGQQQSGMTAESARPQRLFANRLAVISLSLAAASLTVAALTPASCWLLSQGSSGWDALGAVVLAAFAHAIVTWLLALASLICGLRVIRVNKRVLWWLVPMMLVVAAGVFGVLLTIFG